MTPRKRTSDKEQYERFRQAARELGTDESDEAFWISPASWRTSDSVCRDSPRACP
jgi:hypothetical protein